MNMPVQQLGDASNIQGTHNGNARSALNAIMLIPSAADDNNLRRHLAARADESLSTLLADDPEPVDDGCGPGHPGTKASVNEWIAEKVRERVAAAVKE